MKSDNGHVRSFSMFSRASQYAERVHNKYLALVGYFLSTEPSLR